MKIVGKLKISQHVEKFQLGFIAIYAILLLNLLFTLFCREIFATIYALSCGEKLSSKVHLWRKMTNIRSVHDLATLTLVLLPVVTTMGRDSLLNFWNNFSFPFFPEFCESIYRFLLPFPMSSGGNDWIWVQ